MSRKEAPRAGLLKAAMAGQISNAQVAVALRLSVRHVQRLKVRYGADGVAGLRHRLRGRPSARGLQAALRRRARELLRTTYRDVNDCHAAEKLREVEGLPISRASVQRLRRALGLPAKHRRRPREYRARRTPEARMGARRPRRCPRQSWPIRLVDQCLLCVNASALGGIKARRRQGAPYRH